MSTLALSRQLARQLARPGTAQGAAFGAIVINEARLARRTPTAVIGSVGLPVLLTVIFGELAGLAIVLVTSVTAFGAPDPASPAGLTLACLLSVAGLFALGLLIAAVARTAGSVSVSAG